MKRLGIISDTHGLLRLEALAALRGCDLIIHGGDIGTPAVIAQLAQLAPIKAVRGNNDKGPWAQQLPEFESLDVGGRSIYVLHDLAQIGIDPPTAGVHVVVCGHSHKPSIEHRQGVLYLNPGSAGPRRFKLPITVAELLIDQEEVSARIVELEA